MSEHKICWGKVLIGAAIATAAVAVFVVKPEIGIQIMSYARSAASATYHGIGAAGKWLFDSLVGSADKVAAKAAGAAATDLSAVKTAAESSIGAIADTAKGLLPTAQAAADSAASTLASNAHGLLGWAIQNKAVALGTAAVAGGMVATTVGTGKHYQAASPEEQNFAMREDMRRMQALMIARAAAAGNPQAQAMMAQGRA